MCIHKLQPAPAGNAPAAPLVDGIRLLTPEEQARIPLNPAGTELAGHIAPEFDKVTMAGWYDRGTSAAGIQHVRNYIAATPPLDVCTEGLSCVLQAARDRIEELTKAAPRWTFVQYGLPDADTTVQVALQGLNEPMWLGFLSEDGWREVDGSLYPKGAVYAWADMPDTPPPPPPPQVSPQRPTGGRAA